MLTVERAVLHILFAFCVAVASLALAAPSHAASATVDVFGRPVQSASSPAQSASPTHAPSASETRHTFVLPEFARTALATSIIWQGKLNARIADAAQQLHRTSTPWTWLTLIGLAFLYGVLHALGPGHGKLVAGTWLGSRDTRIAQAVALASWSATVQAMSAIVLVFGAVWFAKAGVSSVLSNAASLDIVSYVLLCVAGGWTIYGTLARRDCCVDTRALKLVPAEHQAAASPTSEHEPAYLGTKLQLHMRQSGGATRFGTSKFSATSQILATGFASGVRPCVGSIFVLIASVAAHAPWIGIAATFAIGAGVAVTVSLFGLSAVGANRFIMARSFRLRARIETTRRVVAITGALVIVLFGAVQAALILSGYVQPALT
ncbi:high frequency lysogenization protein HflD [Paraburkholderia caribensis]|uniref:Nickel/cobalt efflux system n=1 Tax=Paraburkholderia caribensis TaxID=75105 RepID=A0A9Q6SAM3_9BURK|nr:high frequency lysogenization protein HflD [Paraburkholderia caribensis]MCO4878981.1 high frequency lysogenization protein HflD [Paraburkholderia caribensis]PTB27554.1 high frequency lysogenization protein HflD [Paraburkholderia caribensis]QLB67391.1 high frequency lysogenization protein HflD [Paraburkholderia caribensis]